MAAPRGPTTPPPRRSRGSTRIAGLPGAVVAIALVVVGSLVALGVADVTPAPALPSAIAAGQTPNRAIPTAPQTTIPTAPQTTVPTLRTTTTLPPTADTTTRVITGPKVSLQDDKGESIVPNAGDGSDGSSSSHPSRHARDS